MQSFSFCEMIKNWRWNNLEKCVSLDIYPCVHYNKYLYLIILKILD